MIVREELTIKRKKYIKTYSDAGYYVERDGVLYAEAIDPIKFKDDRVYTESDILIEDEEAENEAREGISI